MSARQDATRSPGTRWALNTSPTEMENRRNKVAAGAIGTNTGSSVDSLSNNATMGRHLSSVAYQSPNHMLDPSCAPS